MAKRGRKPLISEDKPDYVQIKCYQCGKNIENTNGHPEYKTASIWKEISGVMWPITVRFHAECQKNFLEENSKILYGKVQTL